MKTQKDNRILISLVAARGKDTFGMKLLANNTAHALVRARKLLEGSGYSVYPYKESNG